MDYYHTDDLNTLEWLGNVVRRAENEGLSLRLRTDSQNRLMVKLGGGMWTAPMDSTPDAFRSWTPCHNGCTPEHCKWLDMFKANAAASSS